jgi:hypothetical protein
MADDNFQSKLQRLNDATAAGLPADGLDKLLTTRHYTHGDYADQSLITENLIMMMAWNGEGQQSRWQAMTPAQRHALTLIATKIGRILAGDPDFRDHWVDIAGYATLVADRCTK